MLRLTFIISLTIYYCNSASAQKISVQRIPGKVECEFYNTGGEGIAYHDSDAVNNGSGKLNPVNGTYLNEFRMNEGVDISYTKSNGVDDSPYNKVQPLPEQLYVGWTQPGEWVNYTVEVKTTGAYSAELMYTANGDGIILLDLDGKQTGMPLTIPSTADDRDTIAWRQWHHWNKIVLPGKFTLTKGPHTLTLRTIDHGNMNFDFLYFKKED